MAEYKQCITPIIREALKLFTRETCVQVVHTELSAAAQVDSSARRVWNDGGQKKIVLPAKDLLRAV